ncbi:MAG: cytochrome c, partial [Myxococcota bacterium]|nr:cytochrome c [Myxococcota bacterium]
TADDPADPSGDVEETRAQTILALTGDASAGTATYQTNCQGCHGADGDGPVGTNLQGWVMTEESVNAIIDGKGSMPGFGNYFTDQEIADLVAFVETL